MRIIRKPEKNISKEMIGLFFEDINYAADGGLYAEMIENRSFEAKEAVGVATGKMRPGCSMFRVRRSRNRIRIICALRRGGPDRDLRIRDMTGSH